MNEKFWRLFKGQMV